MASNQGYDSITPYKPLPECDTPPAIIVSTNCGESQIDSEDGRRNSAQRYRWRLISNCLMGFSNGITDSAPGALLPYIQTDYNVAYGVVSLIFVANALGYLFAAPQADSVDRKRGRAGAYAISQALMTIGFLLLACHISFHITIIGFWFIGLGEALNLALNNVFCTGQKSGTSALGLLHGCYGAGGTVGPLLATSIVVQGIQWSSFYWIALSCTVVNGIGSSILFRGYETETEDSERQPLIHDERSASQHETRSAEDQQPTELRRGAFREAIQNRTTILGALFIFAYQGAEVSMSGWMIEFLISYRFGNPAIVGYVTVGFWAGISMGRFLVSPLAHKLGERRSVTILTIGCVIFQIMAWLLKSLIGSSVATIMVGFLLGPVYPCAVWTFGNTLAPNLQLPSLSVISAVGSSGGAVMPLCVGLLAQAFGTVVLHPLCVLMYIVMVVSWISLPAVNES